MLSKTQNPKVKNQKWTLAHRTHEDLVDHLVALRKIDDRATFFTPRFPEHLHDPFLMRGMKAAVDRILLALVEGQVIGIFADYDADGTPGAALLAEGLQALGGQVAMYLPMRLEGYGLSERGIQALHAAGASIMITIDLGVTGKQLVRHAARLGIDVIITDHHTIQDDAFPDAALAVLNPKQSSCAYPDKNLCGGGIAWKLLSAVLARVEQEQPQMLAGRSAESIRRWALDLAGIATIADLVPLTGENRVLAYYGLEVLRKTRRPGLRALYEVAGIDPTKITASTVGFQIAPRLNAPTRMAAQKYQGDPAIPGPQSSISLALLLTRDANEAIRLAGLLQQHNIERQGELQKVLLAAEEQITAQDLTSRKALIVAGEEWPEGIVGLVAARLLERYHRPTFVLSLSGESAAGSARSIEPFHLVDNMTKVRDTLVSYGGHHKAAGLRLSRDMLEEFRAQMITVAEKSLTDDDLIPELKLDAELTATELTLATAERLASFAPHGLGNPRPVFYLPGMVVRDRRLMGKERQHLSVDVCFTDQPEITFRFVGFGRGEAFDEFIPRSQHDFAVQIEVGYWQGVTRLEIRIIDHRPAMNV